jgi:hypothetical protein
MPFDGTDLGFSENHPLTKLGAVERLLATKQLWCKFQLRDRDGRYCLVGAMEAVKARQVLEPIILRAAREVGGKHYWRIEFFNDDSRTSHADILRVLSLARENIIANIIKGHQRRSRPQRLAQAVRARCSGLVERAFKLAHKRAQGAVVFPQKFEHLFGLGDADAQRIERKRRKHSGTTDGSAGTVLGYRI